MNVETLAKSLSDLNKEKVTKYMAFSHFHRLVLYESNENDYAFLFFRGLIQKRNHRHNRGRQGIFVTIRIFNCVFYKQ